jgi:calcineurin-like phosphoesterase family protein
MKFFLTADCHFNHSGIIAYTKRPFKTVDHMNEELIRRWNQVVKPDDLTYHVGDFAFKNSGRKFEQHLNGSIVHIVGNHDYNNQVKTLIQRADLEIGNKTFLVMHQPPLVGEQLSYTYSGVICGHVHDHWKVSIHQDNDGLIPVINVGVDVWGFTPVSLSAFLKFYDHVKNHAECLK